MKITRRGVLSAACLSTLCGCSALGNRLNAPEWSTSVADDLLTERLYVDDEHVAVATPSGRLKLLSTDSGEPIQQNRSRENIGHFAGTPPVSVDDQYLTITNRVYVVNNSGEVTWVEGLPDDGYANIQSSPLGIDGSVYTTTSEGSVYQINITERTITELNLPAIYGYWWDSSEHRVVVGTELYNTTLFDLDSEEVLWSRSGSPVDYPCLYDSDIISSASESDQLVVRRIDPEESTERWTTSISGSRVSFCDRLSTETIAVVSQYPWERDDPAQVTMIDATSGSVTGEYELPPRTIPSGDVSEGRLFLTSSDGGVFSIEPGTNVETILDYDEQISSPPTVHNERVFFGTNDGQVVSFGLTESLNLLS